MKEQVTKAKDPFSPLMILTLFCNPQTISCLTHGMALYMICLALAKALGSVTVDLLASYNEVQPWELLG